jgi:hypothetical protein
MSCCGQKRRAWRESISPWKTKSTTKNVETGELQAPVLQNPVILYHLADTSLVAKGAMTNITYLFGGRGSSLKVDERDVPALLATRQFAAPTPEIPP